MAAVGSSLLGSIAACSSTPTRASRPDPVWPEDLASLPGRRRPAPPTVVAPDSGGIANLVGREQWAKGSPVPALMNRMLPVSSITVHHDGLPPVTLSSRAAVAARIELIRVGHRSKGWGDIGYHFVVDPQGSVWQGRPLIWQGAHVKDRNEGNIGILVLGNFESQRPTNAQLAALEAHLITLRGLYRVPNGSIRTHQEWPGASTLCPGRNLQAQMAGVRRDLA